MHYHSTLEYCIHSFVFDLLEEIFELKSSEFVDKEGIIEGGVTKRLVLTKEGKKKGAILFARIVFIEPWYYKPLWILVPVKGDWRKESQFSPTTQDFGSD
jgi:hypothetical protein